MLWRRVASLVVLLGTALGFALAAPRFRFTTQITDFLPDDSEHRGAQLAALLANSELARIMIIDLSLGPPAGAPAAAPSPPATEAEPLAALARSLLAFLRAHPDVAVARSGFTEADITAVRAFLEALPVTAFLPASAYDDASLRARLLELLDQLGGPAGVVVRQAAPRDPLGARWAPLEALREAQGGALVERDGVLFTPDHAHALMFVETRSSPFDSAAQRRFRAALERWRADVAPPGARLQTAGTAQFAIASEAQIKGDVQRIGFVSTLGILALFWLLFGSLRMIALGFVPMLFGSAVAVLVCQAWFGELHGITLAFGTSLLGVGLDYVEHYYAHFVLTPAAPAAMTMRRVAPSLALGALTTIIGFIGIGASGLMGLRQMAAFSMIAVVASMAATYAIVPLWMPRRYQPPRALALVARGVQRLMGGLLRRPPRRRWRALALALACAAVAATVASARFSDNVNLLVDDQGRHVLDDRAVRSRLGPEASAFAVITAASEEALPAAIGRTGAELARAREAGALARFVPLDQLVPDREQQQARFAAAKAAQPRLRHLFEELGFVPDEFQPFWDALAEASPRIVTLAELRRSPLGPLLAGWLPRQETPLALVPLYGVVDLATLQQRVPSATLVAPAATMVELFRGVRIRTVVASSLGFGVILLLLLLRYRSLRKTLIALTPAMLACAATVGTLVAAGVALTILHVMALLLMVSLGVDFGIFFVDTAETLEESSRTMVSILTASVTTILSFGLLGLSASPGLAALGVTITLGVTFSLLCCALMITVRSPVAAPTLGQREAGGG